MLVHPLLLSPLPAVRQRLVDIALPSIHIESLYRLSVHAPVQNLAPPDPSAVQRPIGKY
ncbi:hypothetical protein D3C84_1254080 [compost metagenome]